MLTIPTDMPTAKGPGYIGGHLLWLVSRARPFGSRDYALAVHVVMAKNYSIGVVEQRAVLAVINPVRV